MEKISDYDEFSYDYSKYWHGRDYENRAEVMAITKILKNINGSRFIDIGGSYGRNAHLYSDKFTEFVLYDYSFETLKRNSEQLLEQYPNARLVAGNVYHMPFAENSFDGGLMIRVLHHISDLQKFLDEIAVIFKPSATYIQELANKIHIKAKISALLRLDFERLDKSPFQQPTTGNLEGSEGAETVFLNYHPSHIKNALESNGFIINSRLGLSYFRSGVFKKLIPVKVLIILERLSQNLLSWSNIPPSILFKTTKVAPNAQNNDNTTTPFHEILICPKCKSKVNINDTNASCTNANCGLIFKQEQNVWDFRYSEA